MTIHITTKTKDFLLIPTLFYSDRLLNRLHLLQTLLQIFHTTLGMWLMLIYMTFNVWLILGLTIGSGFGYFLFAWNVLPDDDVIQGTCH